MIDVLYGVFGVIAFIFGGFFVGWSKVYDNRPKNARLSVFCSGMALLFWSAYAFTFFDPFVIIGFIFMGLMFIVGRGDEE